MPASRSYGLWLVLATLLAGCFQPSYSFEEGTLKCDGESCPPGYQCVQGACWKDPSHPIDASVDDADAPNVAPPDGQIIESPADAAELDAPVSDAPRADGPAVDAPAVDAPAVDAPGIDAPASDAALADGPLGDAPVDGPLTDAPPACSPGAKRCDGNTPQTCGATGTWQGVTPCDRQTCVNGACQGECVAGKQGCLNNVFNLCKADGKWSPQEDCTAKGQTCNPSKAACGGTGGCYGACTPGSIHCTGTSTYSTCDSCGVWIDTGGTCGKDPCVTGKPDFCGCDTPGLNVCTSATTGRTCGADLHWSTGLTCPGTSASSCCVCINYWGGTIGTILACQNTESCPICKDVIPF